MKPGRELDRLVAVKVMGLNIHDADTYLTDEGPLWGIPFYSTDIAAAWEVVERMRSLGRSFSIHSDFGGKWHTNFTHLEVGAAGAYAPTAPHAICLAALKAVGWER